MKKISVFITAMLLSAMVLTACKSGTSEQKEEGASTEGAQTAELYQCPMKCEGEKTYDQMGKCPVCGMDLAKVESK